MAETTHILNIVIRVLDKATKTTQRVKKQISDVDMAMKNFGKATKVAKFNDSLKSAGLHMDSVGRITNSATGKMVSMNRAVQAVGRSMGGLNKRAATFDMRLLSLLFGGMALQRAFGGILRSIINTFNSVEGNTTSLSKAMIGLNAAWEFMKFSIASALNSEFFINVIMNIITFIDKVSALSDTWKITFLAISGGLFILGTGLMMIGQIKLGWDAIFGMGGFLRGTNTMHAKTLGTGGVLTLLRNFAIAGLAIKMLFDLDSYLAGEKDLKELITAFGDGLALFGLISGKPWVIAIGILPRLLPFADVIKEFGTKLVEKGFGRQERGLESIQKPMLPGKVDFLESLLPFATGGLESGVGAIIGGFGEMLSSVDSYVERVDKGKESTDKLSNVMNDKLGPAITANEVLLVGDEGSLKTALIDTGTEMDVISTEKTEGFIAASESRIAQMEAEIATIDAFNEKQKNSLSDFGSSFRNQNSNSVGS